MDRNDAVVLVIALVLLFLIYSFFTSIFRKDEKRFSHERLYVDYSDYRHNSYTDDYSSFSARHPNAYKSSQKAAEIKKTMFSNIAAVANTAYEDYMQESLKTMPSPQNNFPKPNVTRQYKQMLELADQLLPDYQAGLAHFTSGNIEAALQSFNKAIEAINPMDIKNRIELFGMIAECYNKIGNDDGYIQYKMKQVRMERRLKSILEEVFPEKVGSFDHLNWMTPQEAMQRLLKLRAALGRTDSPNIRLMVKRAELDREVAQRVSQLH